MFSTRAFVGVALLVGCASHLALAANDAQQFRAAKKVFLQKISNKRPAVRLEAVDDLADEPSVENVRLLLEVAFQSKFPDVQQAARGALAKFKDDEQVCEYLVGLLKEQIAGGTKTKAKGGEKAKPAPKPKSGELDFSVVAAPVLLTLLSSESAEVADNALELLEKAAGGSEDGETLVGLVADELGSSGDESSVTVLSRLSGCKAVAKSFPAQRAVVQALMGTKQKEAVDVIIGALETADGQVRADIVSFLAFISGNPPANEQATWEKWWQTAKENFEFPKLKVAALKPGQLAPAGASHYYGVPLYANRMVFVLDTSGSMGGPRIEAARRELNKAIDSLHPKIEFTVLVFNVQVGVWSTKLLPATSENKLKAQTYVNQQQLGPATASYDALEAALQFKAEAIYFLTDGAPRGGKTDNVNEIVTTITRLNKARRMSINAFGIGVGPPGNMFDMFLRQLSENNYGIYRRVDE